MGATVWLLTLLAGLVALAVYLVRARRGRSEVPAGGVRGTRDSLVILGISGEGDEPGPGKTALYWLLRTGTSRKRLLVSSMKSNEGRFPISPTDTGLDQPISVIDSPGHPRLRGLVTQSLTRAKAVVVVVDGTRLPSQARRSAELLYELLVEPAIQDAGTPILVFSNKSDISTSVSTDIVRIRLQMELDQVRILRAKRPMTMDPLDPSVQDLSGVLPGHSPNEKFSFDKLPYPPVMFDRGSVFDGQIQPIFQLIAHTFA